MPNTYNPGFYYDLPAEEYFAIDAVSNSRLSLLKRSPLHYKVGRFKEPTKALALGSLVHAGVLEPLAIARRYCFMPNYAKHPSNRTKNGERSFSSSTDFVRKMEADFLELNHDKQIVAEEEYARVCGVAISLSQSPQARGLFNGGQSEVSIVWDDKDTGVRCKARVDYLSDKSPVFADLKTSADALDFEWTIGNLEYHRQMAFYKRGLDALRGDDYLPWIAVVETEIPYCNRVAPMSEEALRCGDKLVGELLTKLASHLDSDQWPGYESPAEWTLPERFRRSEPVELLIGGESLIA
jgi:hypothetical protein